jgi:hypothetical protein
MRSPIPTERTDIPAPHAIGQVNHSAHLRPHGLTPMWVSTNAVATTLKGIEGRYYF